MKITKASVKNRSLVVEFTEKKTFINTEGEPIESVRDCKDTCQDICHDSLIEAFDRLKTHAVLIADVREAIKVENAIASGVSLENFDLEELKTISITGFVVVGNEDDGSEGAMIICQKKTGMRILNITTPTVKFDDPEYFYGSEFRNVIEGCVYEVEEYMAGKVAVKQLEMNFDEGFDGEPEVKGKKPKKSKKKILEAFDNMDVTFTNIPENVEAE